MKIEHFDALVVLPQHRGVSDDYKCEAVSLHYSLLLLKLMVKYMDESDGRSESLTDAFIDTIAEIMELLGEVVTELSKS